MVTLTLPQLVAGRDLADAAVDRLGELLDADVTVDARPLVSGTSSFAGQLVRRVLADGKAAELRIVGGPDDFRSYAQHAATQLGVADRLQTERSADSLNRAS